MVLLYGSELEEFKLERSDEEIAELLSELNDDNKFLINRSTNELPFNTKFRVLRVGHFNRVQGMEGIILILDGTHSKFNDGFDDENFFIELDEKFAKTRLIDNLETLVKHSGGVLSIELCYVKKSHAVDVFRFSFTSNKRDSLETVSEEEEE